MSGQRSILSLLVLSVALVLSACVGLPTSGQVNPGLALDEDAAPPDFSFLPDRPQPGATPEEIVQGFIRAGSGPGLAENWERAREFLAPAIRDSWQPTESVTVDILSDRVYSSTDEDSVTLSLVAVATVDSNGVYERTDAGPTPLPFELARQEDGEWRITQVRDGVVLDQDRFPTVFHNYSLMYFDPTWQYLVPDVRWFPTGNAATSVTAALVNGPRSDWLADATKTAFPESVSARPSVPVESGVAEVDLSESALAVPPDTTDRMLTQLEASLATAGVTEVQLSVGTTPITAEPVPVRSTRVTGPSLVLTDDGLGFLVGGELETVPGLSAVVETVSPKSIQVTAERDWAAMRLTDGTVARQGANGSSDELDTRAGLIDPTIDPFDIVWSVPRTQPAAMVAYPLDGTRVDVADAWPGATQVTSMAVSRDGTRMAAAVTTGGSSEVWIAGVVRGQDGIPQRLGVPISIGAVSGIGVGVAWLDDNTVGVLSHSGEASLVLAQLVGGPATTTAAPAGIASLAGASGVSTVRLRGDDGVLYVRRGTNWQQAASGVLVLATQQGMPAG
ncbi:LpqB family beta-propeller domain-containing protein [Microbacterium pumilum]|uniref:MtrAB system accessory lipoprotein LpqB n=1 Tax=Microbacterium pumilum TaxID=344165 RepID=A0ABN2SEI8_9MICO